MEAIKNLLPEEEAILVSLNQRFGPQDISSKAGVEQLLVSAWLLDLSDLYEAGFSRRGIKRLVAKIFLGFNEYLPSDKLIQNALGL